MHNYVQIPLLQHRLQLPGPQTLRILPLAQLLQRRYLISIALDHDWADIVRPFWVRAFQCSGDGAGLDLREGGVARADVDSGELRAGGGICSL